MVVLLESSYESPVMLTFSVLVPD